MQIRALHPSRRELLLAGALAGGGLLLSASASASVRIWPRRPEDDEDGNVLVVLELAGGNDGLNTIVPYADDGYNGARNRLRVAENGILRLDEYRGLNPLLSGLKKHWDAGRVAIVEGAGYPSPNRSHFASFDIWHAADTRGRLAGRGWLGRTLEVLPGGNGNPNRGVHIGTSLPFSFQSSGGIASCFESPSAYRRLAEGSAEPEGMEQGGAGALSGVRDVFAAANASSEAVRSAVAAYRPRAGYPDAPLGEALRTVAALIQQRVGARIVCARLEGFDTHVRQDGRHKLLLKEWNDALTAFLDDMVGTPRGDRTLVLVYSEFGRRVAENASEGTDHGTAGPMFLCGARVKSGLHGKHPSMVELDEGDLFFTTDFRSVFATVLKGWFGVEPGSVLAGEHPVLPLLA